jgi:hypothetical protein
MVSEIWCGSFYGTGYRGESSHSFPAFGSYGVIAGYQGRSLEQIRYFLEQSIDTNPLERYIVLI